MPRREIPARLKQSGQISSQFFMRILPSGVGPAAAPAESIFQAEILCIMGRGKKRKVLDGPKIDNQRIADLKNREYQTNPS